MTATLDARTIGNTAGVHPNLMKLMNRAIQVTSQPFGVAAKAVRTAEEQHALFMKKLSQRDGYRLKSNHQPHGDGFGHAVDLTPIIGGKYDVNNEPAQYFIAVAMSLASKELGIPVTWGGNWFTPLSGSTAGAMRALVQSYKSQHPGPDFIDLPHFQLLN